MIDTLNTKLSRLNTLKDANCDEHSIGMNIAHENMIMCVSRRENLLKSEIRNVLPPTSVVTPVASFACPVPLVSVCSRPLRCFCWLELCETGNV